MLPTHRRRQILIATAPNDPQAIGLAKELRTLGMNIIVAETVGLASQADEVGACIILLRLGQWRSTPSIVTAMRCNPRYMIPVLAEPMPLPNGSWATEPVKIRESLTTTAKELQILITNYFQTLPESPAASATRNPNTGPLVALPKSLLQPSGHKAKQKRSVLYTQLLVALLILLGLGLLAYYRPHLTLPRFATSTQQSLTASNIVGNHPYIATAPGPGCDAKGADWEVGTYYKVPVTPTASQATPLPKSTPTLQVVIDNSTVTTCQQNGLLVKHMDHFDNYATIIFASTNPLAQHFKTQVTATVVAASNTASFDLGVRNQGNARVNSNGGYGDDTIAVDGTGRWDTQRYNDITDQQDAHFTTGFIPATKTFTLAAEVDGPLMTFSLNGQKVTTIVDPTYPTSYGISFGISDPDAKSPPSALFSQFTYTPLSATNLTTNDVIATATAQAGKDGQTPYTTSTPGFGCDKKGGQWEPVLAGKDAVTTSCLPQGLSVSQGASAKYISDIAFYWLNGNFPTNYKVSVQIDLSKLNGGCAGITTRTDLQAAGYVFFICADGSWQIVRYDSNGGNGHQLASGTTIQRSSYTLEATSNGSLQSLSLNGVKVSSVTDKTLTTTAHVDLSTAPPQGSAGTAIYSNFVFTPLP